MIIFRRVVGELTEYRAIMVLIMKLYNLQEHKHNAVTVRDDFTCFCLRLNMRVGMIRLHTQNYWLALALCIVFVYCHFYYTRQGRYLVQLKYWVIQWILKKNFNVGRLTRCDNINNIVSLVWMIHSVTLWSHCGTSYSHSYYAPYHSTRWFQNERGIDE